MLHRLAKTAGLLAVCLIALVWIGNAVAATSDVDPTLLADVKTSPAKNARMIILSTDDVSGAIAAFNRASAIKDGYGAGTLRKELPLVGGIAVTLPAARVATLAQIEGITVSPDATLEASGYEDLPNIQLWPYLSGNAHLWSGQKKRSPRLPAVAVVDSGIDTSVPDLANSLLVPQVDLCSLESNSPGDGDGHGTFVSSIIAGNGRGHVGAAPNANLISLDVINDEGMATTSDVIAAAQWIVKNRHKYNIKVVNFSLHAVTPSHFVSDPLDKAVEKLWFSGVVVVTAAGNYSVDGEPTAVRYAPGNDPFVITVGALDSKGTLDYSDDTAAPWSTWGHTLDGFSKPEIGASGRYMIGAVPTDSTLVDDFPNNVVSPGYLQLSGTSFAAPIVTGAVAQLLGQHPNLTPDQVKAGLMLGSERTPAATSGSLGLGELNAGRANILLGLRLPNPNAALNQFVVKGSRGSTPYFDGDAWTNAVQTDPNWNSSTWEAKWWTSGVGAAKWWTSGAWATKWWTSSSWEAKWWTSNAWAAKWWTSATEEDKWWVSGSDEDKWWISKWWVSGAEEAKWWVSGSWEAKWWTAASDWDEWTSTSTTDEDKWWVSGSWEAKWWTAASVVEDDWAAQSQIDLQNEVQAQADMSEAGYLLTKSDYLELFRNPFLTPVPWERMHLKK